MFELGIDKCGGCLDGLFFSSWNGKRATSNYHRQTASKTLNGYLDLDAEDPFALEDDDEIVSLNQSSVTKSLINSQPKSSSRNCLKYYRGKAPDYQRPHSSSREGYQTLNGSKHKKESTNQQKPPKESNATHGDEFEQFLQSAQKKSEEMKQEVETYLKTTNDVSISHDAATSQPDMRTFDKSQQILIDPSNNNNKIPLQSLLD